MKASAADTTRRMPALPGYGTDKRDHLRRLAKIEGQVRGIAHMVEEDRSCIDVMTQLAAVSGAVHQVALGLLDEHVRHSCASAAAPSSAQDPEATLADITHAVALTLRL